MVEVDARLDKTGPGSIMDTRNIGKDGPYMCNLAVDDKCQRQGIATALVKECERQVQEWHNQDRQSMEQRLGGAQPPDAFFSSSPGTSHPLIISNSLCLKVRESNQAAVQLYTKLGYRSLRKETEEKSGETVVLMRKELSSVGR